MAAGTSGSCDVRDDRVEDRDPSAALPRLIGNIDKDLAIKNRDKSLHAALPSWARVF